MSDLNIKYGLFNLREEREIARGHFEYIARDIADIKQNYVRLGFHLREFRELQYYEDFGFDDFYEFVEVNFGLDKSAVSRCISVWYRFADYDSNSHTRKMWLSDKWKDYSYSQLCEMLPLDDEKLRVVSPKMTVKEIREYKKNLKNKNATSQPEEGTGDETVEGNASRFFCRKDLSKVGIVLANAVRRSVPLDSVKAFVYSPTGKCLEVHSCDLLYDGDGTVILRTRPGEGETEGGE